MLLRLPVDLLFYAICSEAYFEIHDRLPKYGLHVIYTIRVLYVLHVQYLLRRSRAYLCHKILGLKLLISDLLPGAINKSASAFVLRCDCVPDVGCLY